MKCVACPHQAATFTCICGHSFCDECAITEQHKNQTKECDQCHQNICTSYYDEEKYPTTCWKCFCRSELNQIVNTNLVDQDLKDKFAKSISQIIDLQPNKEN